MKSSHDAELAELLRRARDGDGEALGGLLEIHRDYLRAIAQGLMDPRLGARLDAAHRHGL